RREPDRQRCPCPRQRPSPAFLFEKLRRESRRLLQHSRGTRRDQRVRRADGSRLKGSPESRLVESWSALFEPQRTQRKSNQPQKGARSTKGIIKTKRPSAFSLCAFCAFSWLV